MKRVLDVAFIVVMLLLLTSVASYAQSLPPGDPIALLAWLKGNVIFLQLIVGIVWKYAPFLKGFSNNLIPWVNVAVFLLSLFAGVAMAADAVPPLVHHSFWSGLVFGFIHSGIAKVLYDGWLKPALDATLGKALGTA
jgi:hypothetical protein